MNLRRNLVLYTPYRILSLEAVCHGVYLLWLLREKQLSPAAIAAIHAAGDALLVVLELPTGRFADRFGCRLSLILGSAFQISGCLLLWLGRSVAELTLGALAIATGDAFRSGAADALLYRSCRDGDEFGRLRSVAGSQVQLALMFLGLLGGLIGEWSLQIPLVLETVFCTAGLGVALAMHEPPVARTSVKESQSSSWLFRLDWPALLAGSAIILAACTGGFLVPVEAARLGASPSATAALVAVLMLACATGVRAASRLRPGRYSTALRAMLALATVLTLVAGALPWLALPAVLLLHGLSGAVDPIRAELLQRSADDSCRATVGSVGGLTDMAFKAAGLPLAARMHASFGVSGAAGLALGALAAGWAGLLGRRLLAPRARSEQAAKKRVLTPERPGDTLADFPTEGQPKKTGGVA